MKRKYLKRLEGRRAVIHTRDDQSIRGVVRTVASDVIVLEPAEYLGKASDPDDLEGRAWVPLENVSWGQEL